MAGNNSNLNKAKKEKNDEFYTQLVDVAKEVEHYKEHFKDKIVYCNCDNPEWSAFWKYFHINFAELGLKKLISTHYEKEKETYKMEYAGGDDDNIEAGIKTPLEGNGDFRNQECIELLKEADIVVTNPAFSLFREYVACLMEHKKKFLIIGNLNAITYKEIFPLLRNNEIWMGATYFNGGAAFFAAPVELYDPKKMSNSKNAYMKDGVFYWRVNGVRWFTNLDHTKRHEKLDLWKNYTSEEYPKYDNYNAINVDNCKNIPVDYDGVIGVPISLFDKYCPEQFDILGISASWDETDIMKSLKLSETHRHGPIMNGKEMYRRIFIRKKTIENH